MSGESFQVRPDRRRLALGLAAVLAACGRPGPKASARFDRTVLDKGIQALADRARPGVFNAAILDLADNTSWFWNIDKPFPLAEAAVLPMAAAVLAEVGQGLIKLTDHVTVRATDLSPPYSLIGAQWLDRPENLQLGDLMTLAVQYGDHTAADVLMSVIGGPGAITAWLKSKEVTAFRLDRYAREILVEANGMASFRPDWRTPAAFAAARAQVAVEDRQAAMNAYVADPRDTTTAQDAITFLAMLARNQLTPKPFTDYLLKIAAAGAPSLLGAGLPKGAVFAHHGGATINDLGFTPATADLGVITFKDGRRFAACAFLTGSTASPTDRERLFADAGRLMAQAAGAG